MEVNPFVLRCLASEWKPKADHFATGLERTEYFREAQVKGAQFKLDVFEECNLLDESDIDKLFQQAIESTNGGCIEVYGFLADIAVERDLYVKIPF